MPFVSILTVRLNSRLLVHLPIHTPLESDGCDQSPKNGAFTSRGPARQAAYDTKAGPGWVNLNRPDLPLLNLGLSIGDSRI